MLTLFSVVRHADKRSPVEEEDDDEDEGTQTKSGSSWSIGSIFSGLTNRVTTSVFLPSFCTFQRHRRARARTHTHYANTASR
jgi:hypothetical protein